MYINVDSAVDSYYLVENVSSELPFSCSNEGCKRTFKHKSSLTRHLTYECNVRKSFKCGLCSCWFQKPYDVVIHSKRKHVHSKVKVLQLKDDRLDEWVIARRAMYQRRFKKSEK